MTVNWFVWSGGVRGWPSWCSLSRSRRSDRGRVRRPAFLLVRFLLLELPWAAAGLTERQAAAHTRSFRLRTAAR